MTDDLVKRLRGRFELCNEAADRIEQLQAALVVFAKRSEWYDEDEPDNLRDWDEEAKPLITIKDLRRARAALENKNDR
jgi:hypothetical protein